MNGYFARNIDARRLLDIYLVSAVTSLLVVRGYLHLTGYPQVGGGPFHIAHMLWGGLLMSVAIIMGLSFLGKTTQRIVAVCGGIGFGVFIDELGKFITRDNDYFFQPTIGILYALFVILYLVFNFLGRRQVLTSREYQLNALTQLEEAINADMDQREKARVIELLQQADQQNPITRQLLQLVKTVRPVRTPLPNRAVRMMKTVDRLYQKVWSLRSTRWWVRWFFITEIAVFIVGVVVALLTNFDSVIDFFQGDGDYGHSLVIGQLLSTIAASAFAVVGLVTLRRSRATAFEWFRRATLINLLLTQFFIFSRIQFLALPGLAFNILLLIFVNFILGQEERLRRERQQSQKKV